MAEDYRYSLRSHTYAQIACVEAPSKRPEFGIEHAAGLTNVKLAANDTF